VSTRAQCLLALALHETALSQLPHVVGFGVVGEGLRGLAVAVYVGTKVPRGDLEPAQRIPRQLLIPARGAREGVSVRVLEQGPIQLEEPPAGEAPARPPRFG